MLQSPAFQGHGTVHRPPERDRDNQKSFRASCLAVFCPSFNLGLASPLDAESNIAFHFISLFLLMEKDHSSYHSKPQAIRTQALACKAEHRSPQDTSLGGTKEVLSSQDGFLPQHYLAGHGLKPWEQFQGGATQEMQQKMLSQRCRPQPSPRQPDGHTSGLILLKLVPLICETKACIPHCCSMPVSYPGQLPMSQLSAILRWLCNAISGITLWWGQQMFSASLPPLREQRTPCCPHHKAQFLTLNLPALEKLP